MHKAGFCCLSLFSGFVLAIVPVVTGAAENGCIELASYRDTQLSGEWDRVLNKRALISQGIASATALREDLNDQNWWTLSSIPEIALSIKTTTDLIGGVIASVSPSGNIVRLATSSGRPTDRARMAERISNGLDRGEQISSLVSEQFGELAWSLIADSAGQVGAAVETIRTAADNLEHLQTIGGEKESYRQTLTVESDRLSRELLRLDTQYSGLVAQLDVANGIRDAIDKRCGSKQIPAKPQLRVDSDPAVAVGNRSQPSTKNAGAHDLDAIYRKCRDTADPMTCVDRELNH